MSHHGGAGTTAEGLRAGVPNVIVPSFGDQFFWGWRVQELGVGTKPIPRNMLSSVNMAAAIQKAVNDEFIKHKAAEIGQQIHTEDGIETAVGLIEAFTHAGHF